MYNLSELAKNNNILERDLAVLDALSAGPATLDYLHRMFFKKPDGKMVGKQAFRDYINRLAKDEYIKLGSCHDKTRKDSKWMKRFAVIDTRGADLVCKIVPYKEREHVRMNTPSATQFDHEAGLSNIIRSVWQEARNRDTFKIEHINDEATQKKIYIRQHGRPKGVFFPDLEVKIKPHKEDSNLKINIELDTGQKTRGYWVEKVSSWSPLILVICTEPQRIEYLSYSLNSNQAKLKGTVCFVSYADFLKSGLSYWLAKLNSIGAKNKMVYLYKDYHLIIKNSQTFWTGGT